MDTVEMLETAIHLASESHKGQREKSGHHPYIMHPLRLMLRMDREDIDGQVVAVLHDVVEDTPVKLDDLRTMGFPYHIVDAVDAVTHRLDEERAEYFARAKANSIARRVKVADLMDNMDIRRLPGVEEKDWKRLIRYHTEYRMLTAE